MNCVKNRQRVDLALLLRVGVLHELSGFVCSLASNPVSQHMYVELTWHLEPLFPCHLCVEELGRGGNVGKC